MRLPCIWEEESNGDVSSPDQINMLMAHVSLTCMEDSHLSLKH